MSACQSATLSPVSAVRLAIHTLDTLWLVLARWYKVVAKHLILAVSTHNVFIEECNNEIKLL